MSASSRSASRVPGRGSGRDPRGQGGVPKPVTAIAVTGLAFLLLPLAGLVLRAPWSRLFLLLGDPQVTAALRLSLASSLLALALSTVLGVPLAVLFARRDFPGKALLRALAVLPMVLPPVVGGVGLLLAFGRRGLLGGPLAAATGITIPFSPAAVVLAATFVAMPFLIVSVESGLRMLDRRYEDAAATLGAGRWTTFRRVTIPLILPSIGAGMALTWARALGEFGATITFAGNMPGRTQTMPLAVYVELERNPEAAYLLGLLLLAVSVAVLVALRERFLGVR